MKALILLVLIQASFSWAVVNHAGHNHSAGEECDVAGMPSATGVSLAADVLIATENLNPDQKYCDAIEACGGGTYKTGVSRDPACEITVKPTCGLEGREVAAIEYYTSSGYDCLNRFLWKKGDGPVSGGVETLNEALEKLPKLVGFVQRGTDLPGAVREQHQLGATVTYEAFTSTSTSSGFEGQDKFLIYSQTGRPVMSLSSISGENEVLFQSKTKFRIVSIKDDEYGTKYYIMREVIGSESSKKAKKEDERIMTLAQEFKDKKMDPYSSEVRTARRWECPVGEGVIPSEFKLESRPSGIDSFL